MEHPRPWHALWLPAAAGGVVVLVASFMGSTLVAVVSGLVALVVALVVAVRSPREAGSGPTDPVRRRMLGSAVLAGLALIAGGAAAGRWVKRLTRPDPGPALEGMARGLGGEYLELVARAYHPERSGDLQLLLAPYNSSNYAQESRSLVPRDPRTSHASVWMYLERVPIVVHAPGIAPPGSSNAQRVTLADLAPTTAGLMGFDFDAPDGRPLPGIERPATPPRIILTFVIDGGGWNVLRRWPDAWPNLRLLMEHGLTYRDAIVGSFPAVTACAHANIGTGAFPRSHGVTGHNVRTGDKVVKAYGDPGHADPGFLMVPTLADAWSDATGNRAWIGEIGYQIWHLGMIGRGGPGRGPDELPVAVYWDEGADPQSWASQNPDLYRLPNEVPSLDRLEQHLASYDPTGIDSEFDPRGRQVLCCSPPIIEYQHDLIEATLDSEPIGEDAVTDLLYVNYKSPDYTGHLYGMDSEMTAIALRAVDEQLGKLAALLADRFRPGEYALIVAADHGQCPLPDAAGGTRLDPIQLGEDIEREFRRGPFPIVQSVVPSEIYLDRRGLVDTGTTRADVAAFLADYRYRDNIGPYVPRDAVERDLLGELTFAGVLPTDFIADLGERNLAAYGETRYPDGDPGGVPPPP